MRRTKLSTIISVAFICDAEPCTSGSQQQKEGVAELFVEMRLRGMVVAVVSTMMGEGRGKGGTVGG